MRRRSKLYYHLSTWNPLYFQTETLPKDHAMRHGLKLYRRQGRKVSVLIPHWSEWLSRWDCQSRP